jgi:hypothetical protein
VHELVRTNNVVLITAIEALLKGADIPHVVLDRHMSVLEGSLGILPRRILVDAENWETARQLLEERVWRTNCVRTAGAGQRSGSVRVHRRCGSRRGLRLKQKRRGHRVGHDAICWPRHGCIPATGRSSSARASAPRACPGLARAGRRGDAGEITRAAGLAENIARNGMSER